jgi:Arc/MetJ-type ribon-helix-helix transcriptional regulator
METVSTKLPPKLLEGIDKLVSDGLFGSRSEFLRQAVREALDRRAPPERRP